MENLTIIMLHFRFAIGVSELQVLLFEYILVDKEDRKTTLLRGRLFDMWCSTLGGSKEGGDVFLTCGSTESPSTGCEGPSAEVDTLEQASLHCLQEAWEKKHLITEWRAFKILALSLLWWMEMSTTSSVVFCFHWAWSLPRLSLFGLSNKIMSLFPS